MNTSETLYRAADLIEERGWTTGNPGMLVGGPHCVLGAIGAAYDIIWQYDMRQMAYNPATCLDTAAGTAIRDFLEHEDVEVCEQVWSWNDAKGRTAEQVIEALRAAAVIEAAKETADDRERVTV